MNSDLCVLIPAFNAAKTIGWVVSGALKHVNKVIVADDGSSDNTAAAASDAGAEVIAIGENRGKGHALQMLFRKASEYGYSSVISMDADGQHDPDEIPLFVDAFNTNPSNIVVGSRMHEKEKIPRARYNSMHIARFYISLAANQFIEDTQCGFRLYPLSLINKMNLTTGKYITETEILIKAGDMGAKISFVNVKPIYGTIKSHFRPIMDVAAITAYVIFYLHIKWFFEGLTSNKPYTYKMGGAVDRISGYKPSAMISQTITAFTAVPASMLFLIEYMFLSPFINNFSAVRKLGSGFFKIALASHMLPVLIIVTILERMLIKFGRNVNLVDKFINNFYPHLWGN